MKFKFIKKSTEQTFDFLKKQIGGLKKDTAYICEIWKDGKKRTNRQNRTIHALFTDLATELNGLGIELKFGNFTASWTENTAKELFVECYLGGKRTHETTTAELADAVDKLINDINANGGQLSIKDKIE